MSKFSEIMRTPAKVTPELMLDFLHYYKYEDATLEGCQKIYKTWEKNKAKLLERFRKHPNWDEDNLAIVFKETEYEREFEYAAYGPFIEWTEQEILNLVKEKDLGQEASSDDNVFCYWIGDTKYYLSRAFREQVMHVRDTLVYISIFCFSQFLTDEQANEINRKCPEITVSEGLKLTKAIQRVCKVIGLDKIKDVRQAHEGTDRMKDFGFNYQFQMLADRVNPTKFKRITVISLNPLDYWGMSFGYRWASCHTIDLHNVRENPRQNFHGEWSAGTESYMLDSSSIIFYIIKEDYEGNTYWDEDKMQRVVFCLNDNASMILESRVYPDGRDGGDSSLAQQFRASMQKVVSELFDLNNYWKVEKGTSICCRHVISEGLQYEDYFHYNDVNISFNKDECLEFPKIRIGHPTICPGCGHTHDDKENILCPDCSGAEVIYCAHCGDRIDMDYGYECIGGDYYCCAECAEAEGYIWCEDIGDWASEDDVYYCENDGCYHWYDNCFHDDYDDCYYYGDPEVETNDGNKYYTEENAENDGYHLDYFSDEWMHECDLAYDEYEDRWFDPNSEDAIETADGKVFMTEASAEHAGYVRTWVKESEVCA